MRNFQLKPSNEVHNTHIIIIYVRETGLWWDVTWMRTNGSPLPHPTPPLPNQRYSECILELELLVYVRPIVLIPDKPLICIPRLQYNTPKQEAMAHLLGGRFVIWNDPCGM